MTKQSWGYLEGWISIVLNTAIFAVKFWVGTACGSVAMIADAWHTLSDTLTSVVVILGFWIAARPADYEHPFGHGRAEPVAAIVIGTLLGVVAFFFLHESLLKLRHPEHYPAAHFSALAIGVFLASVFLKEGLAQFSIWAGRKIDSASLIADGWHHRSDAVASALIVVGGLFAGSCWWMDGVLGVGVSFLIAYAAYDVIRSATSVSLGEAHSPDLERRVMEIIAATAPEVANVHHLLAHKYGDHVEITLHLCFPPEMKIETAHAISGKVKHALRHELNVEPTTHLEPASAPR
jgi:cation diffusion facilitator family transporter